MSKLEQVIKTNLRSLNYIKLELINESYKHRGHTGWNESGETHFNLLIVTDSVIGQNKVQRHKLIYQLLAEQLKNQIHALSIQVYTQDEFYLYSCKSL